MFLKLTSFWKLFRQSLLGGSGPGPTLPNHASEYVFWSMNSKSTSNYGREIILNESCDDPSEPRLHCQSAAIFYEVWIQAGGLFAFPEFPDLFGIVALSPNGNGLVVCGIIVAAGTGKGKRKAELGKRMRKWVGGPGAAPRRWSRGVATLHPWLGLA